MTPLTSWLLIARYSRVTMRPFAILTTRKRAIVALVHAAAFLALAIRDCVAGSRLNGILIGSTGMRRSIAFAVIYLIVSGILVYLLGISQGVHELLYFALCTASASSGLLRAIVGDYAFWAGQYVRVLSLSCAVVVGFLIVRLHSTRTSADGVRIFSEEASDAQ